MFGDRCLNLAGCGHTTNWTCPCTCDEVCERLTESPAPVIAKPAVTVESLKAQIEGMALYLHHDAGCEANDFDYLDRSPCTCGLRTFYNPKGVSA